MPKKILHTYAILSVLLLLLVGCVALTIYYAEFLAPTGDNLEAGLFVSLVLVPLLWLLVPLNMYIFERKYKLQYRSVVSPRRLEIWLYNFGIGLRYLVLLGLFIVVCSTIAVKLLSLQDVFN